MDITQELKDTENALRDHIAVVLSKQLGDGWVEQCGVSEDRLERWRQRKEFESKRQEAGVVDERLIYYADFFDLRTILKKHWTHFAESLGDWKTMEVYLTELERLRDPDAHRRELLPHQKHLILGIGGEIRTRLVRHRSKQDTLEDYFPRFESARDSLGNIWTPATPGIVNTILTEQILRPGDRIDYVVTATDPLGESLEFAIAIGPTWQPEWVSNNSFSVTVEEKHIGRYFGVSLFARSKRKHHASRDHDAKVEFSYTVLPPRVV